LSVFQAVGPFREELFIDYVDHEYALRARSCGVRILRCEGIGMEQPIGETHLTPFGHLRSTHSPVRTYYFFRNSLAIALEYASRFPSFALWIGWQQFKTLVKVALFLQPKVQYLRAVRRGWMDGIAGRLGRMPDAMLR
jgi:rhamnosyltransferase